MRVPFTVEAFMAFLDEPGIEARIQHAIEDDDPPNLRISAQMLKRFGPLEKPVRAYACRLLRRKVESMGHEHVRSDVNFRVPGNLYRSGSLYGERIP
ncbi:hypothetical protein [Bradyrhizobium sp.]|uniref:hypothetical protein n=1 Tax=Bradyrhizobium sp. TaxID=376 RepID=UPI0007C8B527|nr:hypothetical protein [Bradyrhizobium sp.]